jgi:hypothetical protein
VDIIESRPAGPVGIRETLCAGRKAGKPAFCPLGEVEMVMGEDIAAIDRSDADRDPAILIR